MRRWRNMPQATPELPSSRGIESHARQESRQVLALRQGCGRVRGARGAHPRAAGRRRARGLPGRRLRRPRDGRVRAIGWPAPQSARSNAALIAGDPPERRLERLKAFWDLVSSRAPGFSPLAGMDLMRPWLNRMSAASATVFGIPGFYAPVFRHPLSRPRAASRRSVTTIRNRCARR